MTQSKNANIALIAGAVLAVIGCAVGVYKWVAGDQVTGLSSLVIWGIEVAGIYTAAAFGAGALAVVGLKDLTGGQDGAVRSKLLAAAIACLVTTGILVLLDLANPVNIMGMITGFNPGSFMTWDMCMLAFAVIVAIAYFATTRGGAAGGKALAVLAVIAALAVVLVEALMTASVAGRSEWANGLIPAMYIAGGLLAGGALAWAISKEAPAALFTAVASAALVACMVCELVTGGDLGVLTSSPMLWIAAICLIAVVVLAAMRKSPIAALVLASVGILCEKGWTLYYGQVSHLFSADTFYAPGITEIAVTVGMAGLALALYELIARGAGAPKETAEAE